MRIGYLAQPDVRLGDLFTEALAAAPAPRRVVIVSAFAALQTIMRLKIPLLGLRDSGSAISVVVGLDMGGTSKEVLQQLATWDVTVTVVKNRIPGHTFHPKLYLFEWENRAKIIVGSSNVTEGGFYRNYEASAYTEYDLPAETRQYEMALRELRRFIEPAGPTAKRLTPDYLIALVARPDVPSEAEARERATSQFRRAAGNAENEVFGSEVIAAPPPLPAELLERLIARVGARRRPAGRRPRQAAQQREGPRLSEQISPAAFYMSLPTLQGRNIPGEARIPLAAIELAEQFWGWPEQYVRTESPRRGRRRVYHEWKPIWRIWNVARRDAVEQPVRMYMYENSSDFRFYARPLVTAGGDLGDIVRIVRVAEPAVEYECALAKDGTPEHRLWQRYCTTLVRNSTRRFGYG